MMLSLIHYLGLSTGLFAIGLAGVLMHRYELIRLFISIELLLLAVNTQFIALAHYIGALSGQIIVFFILGLTASETAIALAVLLALFRTSDTITLASLNQLKG